ncbi:cell division protein FtsL [Paludibacterium purpuratum]|uniref:Cell division protein FtsL n=1 Tax=Paludibacterium purpuratum TaxID=1144873 RepID=A0A4R7B0T8_9NEIS|nr:cell division protein FtsL [Paludibacterium purpuratum]TDR76558.1 cell division protein FtsL [Paludibacterium purpuratum]
MNKLNAILLALVVFCSWSVVTSQHVSRMLYSDLQKEQKSQQQLDVEYGQLMLEQGTWGAHAVIEKAAQTRLGMHTPDPRQVQVVTAGAT